MDIGPLKREDYEVWMPFLDARVLMRYVPLDELRGIMRRATRGRLDAGRRISEETDALEANRLLGRAAVRGWRGITMDGEDYPYSPEGCDFFMTRWGEFARFVAMAAVDLQALVAEEVVLQRKNSLLTSGPDSTTRA